MQNTINKIETLRATLQALLPMKPEWQKMLDQKFLLEFNYNSNHIEGSTLTYGETKLLLLFGKTTGDHTKREWDEMQAHNVALLLIQEWAANKEHILTESNIRDLNEIILVEPFWKGAITEDKQPTKRLITPGFYKQYPNSVELSNGQIFEYASVIDTPILMGELINWYREEVEKNELHQVALAALLHYKFVRIHPFDDGNGRLARLLMNYVLLQNNLPPVVIKSTDKTNYLFALNKADSGDLNAFVTYIAKQLEWSLELSIKAANGESIEEADDIQKEISLWKKKLGSKADAKAKTDELIVSLFNDCLKDFFEEYRQAIRENFEEMFLKWEEVGLVNGKSENSEGFELIKMRIERLNADVEKKKKSSIIRATYLREDIEIFSARLMIHMNGFKKDSLNTFNIATSLTVQFEEFKYWVKVNDKLQLEKLYGDIINADEKANVIGNVLKNIFAELKTKTNG